MSWNILFENSQFDALLQFLATAPAEIVALQELTAEHVARIQHDTVLGCRYPHQILWTSGYGAGMGLLSRYPVVTQGALDKPPTLWARLDLGDDDELLIVSAHPTFFPPRTAKEPPLPPRSLFHRITHLLDRRFLRYSTVHRDDGIARVRCLVNELRAHDIPLVVVGDFNVTEREQAYREIAADLTDVHSAAGTGSGLTWRPEWLAHLPLALLRIDHMFSSSHLKPLCMRVDTTPRGSDHSPIRAEFELR